MTFNLNSLKLVESFGSVGSKGQGLYGYATDDTKATVQGAGYFNGAAKLLKVGDQIHVSGDIDGTPFHTSYVVSSNNGTTVAITEHSAVTAQVKQEILAQKISTKASDAEVFRYTPNFAGSITKLRTILNGALATGNATATVAINGTNVTNGAVTMTQSGSAAGDVAVATPTALNTFAAGDKITVTIGGSSTATATANMSMELTPS